MINEQYRFIYNINEHYFDVWISYLLKGGSAEKKTWETLVCKSSIQDLNTWFTTKLKFPTLGVA